MKFFNKFVESHMGRIVGLDILRSIAILLVVYGHGRNLLPERLHNIYDSYNPIKIDGVSIFFVLSGFLIGGILLKVIDRTNFGTKDLVNFWIRRWFRTIPNYLIVLLGILAYSILISETKGAFNFSYLFFLQNFASPHPEFFPEAWSLTIEEWFYLLFPATCFVLHRIFRNKPRSILVAALIFIIFPLILRIAAYASGNSYAEFDLEMRKVVIMRLDSLMYGVIGAYILFKSPVFWQKSKYVCLALGLLSLILLYLNFESWKFYYGPWFFNVESMTAFCFLPFLSSLKTTRIRMLDSMVIFISLISYSMYLLNLTPVQWHAIPVINILFGRDHLPLEEAYAWNYVLFWIFTIVFSWLLYRFYEKPLTDLRDRYRIK